MKRMFGILALMVITSIMIAGCVQPAENETVTPATTPGLTETPTGTVDETPMETATAISTETPEETITTMAPAETETAIETAIMEEIEITMVSDEAETPPGTPVVVIVADEIVSITDSGFVPETLTVPAGTTVEWTNDASADQTVSTTGDTGFLSSGVLKPGDTYTYTFSAEGNYTYQSWISGSTGTVIVTP